MNDAHPERLLGQAMAMITEVEKAAAFGAHLRALTEPLELPAAVADALRELAEAMAPGVSELPSEVLAPIRAGLIAFFRQAADLLEQPDRPPGWLADDPVLLQAQGRVSASVAAVLAEVAGQLEGVAERLAAGGGFCDVGTGVGWLAITAARQWPAARVVGIDVNSRALALAARNLAEVGLEGRIELRPLDVCALSGEAFDLVWLPGPFLPRAIVPAALRACCAALRPGGWVAFGTYPEVSDPVARALGALRTIRSGGHPWSLRELAPALADAGLTGARAIDRTWSAPVGLVVAQRPRAGGASPAEIR